MDTLNHINLKRYNLPFDNLVLDDDELFVIRGGDGSSGSGSGCGCSCSNSGCGCGCENGSGCGCACSCTTTSPGSTTGC